MASPVMPVLGPPVVHRRRGLHRLLGTGRTRRCRALGAPRGSGACHGLASGKVRDWLLSPTGDCVERTVYSSLLVPPKSTLWLYTTVLLLSSALVLSPAGVPEAWCLDAKCNSIHRVQTLLQCFSLPLLPVHSPLLVCQRRGGWTQSVTASVGSRSAAPRWFTSQPWPRCARGPEHPLCPRPRPRPST